MNNIIITKDACIGYTTKNEQFLFDEDDLEKVMKYTWHINSNGYVRTNATDIDTHKQKKLSLHRIIMNENDPNIIIDHINGNRTDNRKSQLRRVTPMQNSQNHKEYKTNTSGVTGVYWNKNKNKWQASINENGRLKYLGIYDSKDDAIHARMKAENKLYGEYSRK